MWYDKCVITHSSRSHSEYSQYIVFFCQWHWSFSHKSCPIFCLFWIVRLPFLCQYMHRHIYFYRRQVHGQSHDGLKVLTTKFHVWIADEVSGRFWTISQAQVLCSDNKIFVHSPFFPQTLCSFSKVTNNSTGEEHKQSVEHIPTSSVGNTYSFIMKHVRVWR